MPMRNPTFNPFPKYLQIRDSLIRRLRTTYAPGDRFPTEHELREEFGVSRETIREALLGLERQGLISRRQGQGTFVEKMPDFPMEQRYTGLVEDFTELGFATESKVLKSAPTVAPLYVTKAMGLPADQAVHQILRLRYLDGEPLALHDTYITTEMAAALSARKSDLEHTTLVDQVSKLIGRPVEEEFQGIDAAVADAQASSRLGVPIGSPLLVIRRVFEVESGGQPMFFESYFRSDRYFYTVQLAQPKKPVRKKPSKQAPKS